MTTQHPRIRARSQGGFTLSEVLIALGIFLIGFTMVLAVFPAAILIQKKTVDAVQAQHVMRNARELISGSGRAIPTSGTGLVEAMSLANWPIEDRSYPHSPSMPNDIDRRYIWVPLYQDMGDSERLFVFVLRRGEEFEYPKGTGTWANPGDSISQPGVLNIAITNVASAPDRFVLDAADFNSRHFDIGDWVLDDLGNVFRVSGIGVVEASSIAVTSVDGRINQNAASLWFAPPGQVDGNYRGPSPALAISVITGLEAGQ